MYCLFFLGFLHFDKNLQAFNYKHYQPLSSIYKHLITNIYKHYQAFIQAFNYKHVQALSSIYTHLKTFTSIVKHLQTL